MDGLLENNVSLEENNQLGNGENTLNSDINTNDSVVGDLDLKANIMNEIGQEFGKIKYLDMEHNLEVNSGVNSVINDDEPFSLIKKISDNIKDALNYDAIMGEVEKIGEDVARYKWAYDEGKFGEFNGGKFLKEIVKSGIRSGVSNNLHMASNVMKMIGKNIDEKSSVGKSLSFGVGALVPNGGTLFNEIGDGLELIASNVENLEILSPSEEVFDEDPNWVSLANTIGGGAGSVLAMGATSKLIGSRATYGLFALGGSGDVFDESFEKDKDINKANMLAVASGGTSYAIDRIFNPLPKQFEKGVKATSSMIANEMLGAPLREAKTEVLQQVVSENLIRKVGIDDTQALFEGLIESAIGGMGGSFSVSLGDGSIYALNKKYRDIEKRIMLKGVSEKELEQYKTNMLEFMKTKPEAFDKILRYNLKQNMREIVKNAEGIKEKFSTKKELKLLPKIYDKMYDRVLEVTKNEGKAKAVARVFEGNALFLYELGVKGDWLKLMEGFLPKIEKSNFSEFQKNGNGENANFQFIGINAKNIDMEKLAEFEMLEKENVDPQDLWRHTGFVRGSDGVVRQDVFYGDARIKLWDNYDYENYAKSYQKSVLHDLELLKTELAYSLSPNAKLFQDDYFLDFYNYLKENDSLFEKLEVKGDFDDPFTNVPDWQNVVDEAISMRRMYEESVLSDLFDSYESGRRDFNEQEGKTIEGIKEKKRYDEFIKRYWKKGKDWAYEQVSKDLKNDVSEWSRSAEFVGRMTDLAKRFHKKREDRRKEVRKSGILLVEDFLSDIDVEESYLVHLAQKGDIFDERADRNYRFDSYREAYKTASLSEKFLDNPKYDFLNDTHRNVLIAYLDNVERYYRLERFVNFAKEVEKNSNIKSNRSLATKSLDYGKFNQTDMGRLLVSNGKTFKLDDILEYDTILSNYPDIKESVVSFTRLNDGEPYHFYYDQELMKYVFEVDAEQLDTSMLSDILVKGTNFAVQHKEGFDYSLTEKQRKNFMDRHVFMAKKEFVDDFKDELVDFVINYGIGKNEKDALLYWKEYSAPVSMLNIYKSEAVGGDGNASVENVKIGEVDFDKLTDVVLNKFPRSSDEHKNYIHKKMMYELNNMRSRQMANVMYLARYNSGIRDVGLPWGGRMTQGEIDNRVLFRQDYKNNNLERDSILSFSDGVDNDAPFVLGYKGDVLNNIIDDEIQFKKDKQAMHYINQEAAKGAYDFSNNVIHLFNGADSETIIHECFHYFHNFLENSKYRNNFYLDNYFVLLNDIKKEFLKEYKIENYNGKYYAMYKNGMGVVGNVPIGYDSKDKLLEKVSQEIFVERFLRLMNGMSVNVYDDVDAFGEGSKEIIDNMVSDEYLNIKVDRDKMVQAYDLYGKWLKSMMHSLKLEEDKLGVGGRDIFDNIIGKKNK